MNEKFKKFLGKPGLEKNITDLFILVIITLFLFYYFKPELLFSNTRISAGDTVGHYYGTYYMNKYLIPHGKITFWSLDWFLGYPAFQFYFPLVFFLTGLLGYLIPLAVSFKIGTVLGVFMLPICTYFAFKAMGFKFPTPIIASCSTLILLFLERISKEQILSMWGGNIPSVLAGEFSYGFSLAIGVLFLGFMFRGVERKSKKNIVVNSILFSACILSHMIVAIYIGISTLFFLLDKKRFKNNLLYLLKVYLMAFLITGFWVVPMLAKTKYTVPHVWGFPGRTSELIKMIFPEPLRPFYFLSLISTIIAIIKREKRVFLFVFSALMAFLLFILSPVLNELDIPGFKHLQLIKFIPYMYLSIIFTLASGFAFIPESIKGKWTVGLIVLVICITWVKEHVTYIPYWIKWNYEGYEAKNLYDEYKNANDFLATTTVGRVAFEYDPDKYDKGLGSSRATETIPIFSGRPITEGTHFQSAFSGPYIYNAHCEYSNGCSCLFGPISGGCPGFNFDLGTEHMKLFNVKYFFVSSDKVKNILAERTDYKRVYGPAAFEVWELTENDGNYVVIPDFEPVIVETDKWRELSYDWFRNPELLDIPVVFTNEIKREDELNFKTKLINPDSLDSFNIEKIPLDKNCTIQETVRTEEIKIKTSCIDKPLWIKMSYFPNWKVEGADKVYLTSPSFMMIFPKQEEVRIYYGMTTSDILGNLLTVLGIGIILYVCIPIKKLIPARFLHEKKIKKNKSRSKR